MKEEFEQDLEVLQSIEGKIHYFIEEVSKAAKYCISGEVTDALERIVGYLENIPGYATKLMDRADYGMLS